MARRAQYVHDGDIVDDASRRRVRAISRRWGRFVKLVANNNGAAVDAVFDLARELRLVDSWNCKPEYDRPELVVGHRDTGGPISLDQLDEILTHQGVDDRVGEDGAQAAEVSNPAGWQYAEQPCSYVRAMVNGWQTANPAARHPWALGQAVRIAAAHALGCLTEQQHRDAANALRTEFTRMCARPGDTRPVKRLEVEDMLAAGVDKAARKTRDELLDELGGVAHDHHYTENRKTRAVQGNTRPGGPDDDKITDGAALLRERMRNGAWLDSQQFPPLEYVVPGMITEGMGLIVGPPKIGKSWLVGSVALSVAPGGLALGKIKVDPRPVLYLALEDGDRRLQSRCRHILGEQAIPDDFHRVTQAQPDEVLPMIEAFLHMHADRKPLVILDTFGKVKPPKRPGDDSYQFDYAIGSKLKNAVDAVPGSALLVVHHTRKAEAADFIDAVSGTHELAGSADFVMVLTRKRHSDEAVLAVTGRDIPEAEYALYADDGMRWRLDGLDLESSRKVAQERREAEKMDRRGDRTKDVLFKYVEGGQMVRRTTLLLSRLTSRLMDRRTAGTSSPAM